MPVYRIVYIGHVNEIIRPGDFPTEIISEEVMQFDSKASVYKRIQEKFGGIMAIGAMGAMKPEFRGETIDPNISIEKSMMVPIHMFSHLTVEIQQVTGTLEEGGLLN